ncbi:DUF3288 family protein [Ancylothrix sp. C2]|uniref:DUF3288 family protein n=1 Tax=Ancylothrix sp. D3o TaxID=2953691 RepID=UPI0021BAB9D2|nr:DUF3288 family protein [Ancylothrix sp. D3o]MCT7950461.1 DUF3288 family protein [Ancylothrix sp. D3o]
MAQSTNLDQKHPQEKKDSDTIATILAEEPSEYYQAELARLIIRYKGFPGAKEIKKSLQEILDKWGITEEKLFELTREIHANKNIFKSYTQQGDEEEWI